MFKYMQLTLTLALLSVFAQPSLAQNAPPPPLFQSFLISGAPTEKVGIAFNLNPIVDNDGAADNCHTSFEIAARDAKGESSYVTTEVVDLIAGQTQIVEFSFGEFSNGNGSSHAIVTVSDLQRMGPCEVISFLRIADANTEETRGSGPIIVIEPCRDPLCSPPPSSTSGSPLPSQAVVSGASTEHWELALVLNRNVNVNGVRQGMPAANCGFEATFTARDATGNSSFEISGEIALGAGQFQSKGFGFVVFASDDNDAAHVIVEISDVHKFGPCQVLSVVRISDAATGVTLAADGILEIDIYPRDQ